MDFSEVKIEVFIPEDYVDKLKEELNKANVCKVGASDSYISILKATGYSRCLDGPKFVIKELEESCRFCESKVEFRCKLESVEDALVAIKDAHPYEEPIINVTPLLNNMFNY